MGQYVECFTGLAELQDDQLPIDLVQVACGQGFLDNRLPERFGILVRLTAEPRRHRFACALVRCAGTNELPPLLLQRFQCFHAGYFLFADWRQEFRAASGQGLVFLFENVLKLIESRKLVLKQLS